MFQLFKATAIVSIATIVNVLTGIVRTKFTAVTLEPSGLGIFSQITNFAQFAVAFSSLSIGLGVTKYIAQYLAQDEKSKVEGVIASAFWMQVVAASFIFVGIIIFSSSLSRFLFASDRYGPYLIIASIGVPFILLATTIECILFGFGLYKVFAKARSVSTTLSLIPLAIFISTMKVKGGFFFVTFNGLIRFAVYCYYLHKNILKNAQWKLAHFIGVKSMKENFRKFGKGLISYGTIAFVGGILSSVNDLVLRSLVVGYLGPEANGLYQVVYAVSMNYLLIFTNGLWSYFYPKVSALKDMRSYSLEMNYAVRFCIFGIAPFLTGLFLLRSFIIHTIFSSRFNPSSELFATQLCGDFFYLLYYIMATALLAREKLITYLLFGVLYSACYISSFMFLHTLLGLRALPLSYLITSAVLFLSILYYHAARGHVKVYARNVKLFVWGIVLVAILLFTGQDTVVTAISKIALLALWAFLMSRRSERKKALAFVSARARAIGRAGYAR